MWRDNVPTACLTLLALCILGAIVVLMLHGITDSMLTGVGLGTALGTIVGSIGTIATPSGSRHQGSTTLNVTGTDPNVSIEKEQTK